MKLEQRASQIQCFPQSGGEGKVGISAGIYWRKLCLWIEFILISTGNILLTQLGTASVTTQGRETIGIFIKVICINEKKNIFNRGIGDFANSKKHHHPSASTKQSSQHQLEFLSSCSPCLSFHLRPLDKSFSYTFPLNTHPHLHICLYI